MLWITFGSDPSQQPNLVLFADDSPIKLKLYAGDSIVYSEVNAGQTQKDYMEYKGMIANFVSVQQKMQNDFTEAAQKGDINAQTAIRGEFDNLNAQYINSLKEFIKSHPKSAMSAHVLNNDLNNQNIPIAVVEECLGYMDVSMTGNSNVKATQQRLDDKRGTMVGYKATNFSQADANGKQVQLSDFRGKICFN